MGRGAKAGFQDLHEVRINLRGIVDNMPVIHMDTDKALAGRVLWVHLEVNAGFKGGSEEKPARENCRRSSLSNMELDCLRP